MIYAEVIWIQSACAMLILISSIVSIAWLCSLYFLQAVVSRFMFPAKVVFAIQI